MWLAILLSVGLVAFTTVEIISLVRDIKKKKAEKIPSADEVDNLEEKK